MHLLKIKPQFLELVSYVNCKQPDNVNLWTISMDDLNIRMHTYTSFQFWKQYNKYYWVEQM